MENVKHFDVCFPDGNIFTEGDARHTHVALISERTTKLNVGRKNYLLKPCSILVLPARRASNVVVTNGINPIAVLFSYEDFYAKTRIAKELPLTSIGRKSKPWNTGGHIMKFLEQIHLYGDAVNTMPIMDFLYNDFFREIDKSNDKDELAQAFQCVMSEITVNKKLVMDLCGKNISLDEMRYDLGWNSKRRLYNLYKKATGINPGKFQRLLLTKEFFTMVCIPEFSVGDMMQKCGSYSRDSFLVRLRKMLEASPEEIRTEAVMAISRSSYYSSKRDLTYGVKALEI